MTPKLWTNVALLILCTDVFGKRSSWPFWTEWRGGWCDPYRNINIIWKEGFQKGGFGRSSFWTTQYTEHSTRHTYPFRTSSSHHCCRLTNPGLFFPRVCNYVVNPVLLLFPPTEREKDVYRACLFVACLSAKRVGRGRWNGFMCGDKCNFNWWRLMIVHSEYRWWAHCCVAWRLSEFSKLIHSGHHHITGKTIRFAQSSWTILQSVYELRSPK